MQFSLTALPHRLYRLLRIERRAPGARNRPVTLSRQRVYILPTRFGLVFALLVFVMATGAANYNNNVGFILTFLLAGLGLVTILHTYRNLAHLTFRAGRAWHVFCGEPARFTVFVDNPHKWTRRAVALSLAEQAPVLTDIAAGATTEVELSLPSQRRGYLPLSTLTISTRYPLGIFYAWSHVRLDMTCLVYPRPAAQAMTPARPRRAEGRRPVDTAGNDDFLGYRPYQPGDSPRHVDWKAVARGKDMLTKQFADNESDTLWLDWDDLREPDGEARLSRLCRGVIDAENASLRYGLRLPGVTLPVARGDAHRQRCLEALALYEVAQ